MWVCVCLFECFFSQVHKPQKVSEEETRPPLPDFLKPSTMVAYSVRNLTSPPPCLSVEAFPPSLPKQAPQVHREIEDFRGKGGVILAPSLTLLQQFSVGVDLSRGL